MPSNAPTPRRRKPTPHRREISSLAGYKAAGRPDTDPVVIKARRDLNAAKLETAVRSALAEAPPLTDEQCQRIAGLLLSGGQG